MQLLSSGTGFKLRQSDFRIHGQFQLLFLSARTTSENLHSVLYAGRFFCRSIIANTVNNAEAT